MVRVVAKVVVEDEGWPKDLSKYDRGVILAQNLQRQSVERVGWNVMATSRWHFVDVG